MTSIPEEKKVLTASIGELTIGSLLILKLVFITLPIPIFSLTQLVKGNRTHNFTPFNAIH